MRRHAEYVDNLHPPTTGAVSTGQHAHASSNLDAWALLLPRQTGGTGRPRSHRRPRGGCVDLACPKRMKGTRAGKTFAANTSLPQPLKHLAATATPEISREQTSEPAKPSLRDLAGVKPADTPTEQDGPKRDRPRLVFQPIHAVIAILTLSCALCASLTMLVQQAIHYSALQQTQITQSKQSQANGTTKDGASSAATTPNQQPSMEQNGQNKQTSEPTEPSDPADGLLNINTAGSNELQTLKGVGPVTAQRIIDYRNQIGRFDNVDQLLEVKGIGEKTLAKFRDQVCAR